MQDLSKLLNKVTKPSRYTGGEYGDDLKHPGASCHPSKILEGNLRDAEGQCAPQGDVSYISPLTFHLLPFKFCMCFPDLYEVGMSNAGIRIISDIINKTDGAVCDRCFTPYNDFAEVLKQNDMPLYSLSLKKPLAEFDMLGFSLQYELCYTNVLQMLSLAGIPLLAKDRGENYPVIIAGGPCCVNPEPIADFIDLFVIGDGEKAVSDIIRVFKNSKNKKDFLTKIIKYDGMYAPNRFVDALSSTATPSACGVHPSMRGIVKKAHVNDINKYPFPDTMLVSNIEAVHDRAVLEIMRGCGNGCRFCQAGFIYRPVRERDVNELSKCAINLLDNTGFDEISLNSLSTGDYSNLMPLIDSLKNHKRKVKAAFPSLRIDSFTEDFIQITRLSSLTFAIEAGSQRLRNVINKNITDEEIINCVKNAFSKGYFNIKLYFMLGLPTETDGDVLAIIDIVQKIKREYKNQPNKKPLKIGLSVNAFIPKPFTPFSLEKMISKEEFEHKIYLIKNPLKKMGVTVSYSNYGVSSLEAIFARGDRKLCKVLQAAFESGCVLDGWTEIFDRNKWTAAFEKSGVSEEAYLNEIPESAVLPWDFIDMKVSKEFLLNERKKAYAEALTPPCSEKCSGCGIECKKEII